MELVRLSQTLAPLRRVAGRPQQVLVRPATIAYSRRVIAFAPAPRQLRKALCLFQNRPLACHLVKARDGHIDIERSSSTP